MRVFFRYRSFNVADRDFYVNNLVFKKGNYISKRPMQIDDWKDAEKRSSYLKRIHGGLERYKRQIFYSKMFTLRRKSCFAKEIISER
jgi:hypothetical protein